MPSIAGVSHINLTVSDLAKSERWYSDLFGFKTVLSAEMPDKSFKVAYLQDAPSGVVLGLVQHRDTEAMPFRAQRLGLDHVSFAVTDREGLRAWEAKLKEHGIETGGITEQAVGAGLNFSDPDGLPLEFYVVDGLPA